MHPMKMMGSWEVQPASGDISSQLTANTLVICIQLMFFNDMSIWTYHPQQHQTARASAFFGSNLVVISLIAAASKTPQLPTSHNTHRRSSRRTLTTPAVEGRFRPRRWRHLPNVASRFETAMWGVAGRKYLSFSEMDTKYYANGLVKKRIGWIWNGFEWYYQGRHIRFNLKWCTNSGEWGHSLNFSTVFVAATKPTIFEGVWSFRGGAYEMNIPWVLPKYWNSNEGS